MTTTSDTAAGGSYLTPAFENARVGDAMRTGVLSCSADTPLVTVARMMATHHIHCVVVMSSVEAGDRTARPWGIVSDIDLLKSAGAAEDCTAGDVCATEVVSVGPDEALERAARLMVEHEISHLVVVDRTLQVPVGVLSSLDVAGAIAWGRG